VIYIVDQKQSSGGLYQSRSLSFLPGSSTEPQLRHTQAANTALREHVASETGIVHALACVNSHTHCTAFSSRRRRDRSRRPHALSSAQMLNSPTLSESRQAHVTTLSHVHVGWRPRGPSPAPITYQIVENEVVPDDPAAWCRKKVS
jgi:hypothetical protein